jgi:hypothetical protein
LLTINQIRDAVPHFFAPSNMRSFDCQVHDTVYAGEGGIYFVTGERMNDTVPYEYTVRQFVADPPSVAVERIGEFGAHKSLRAAVKVAKERAGKGFTETHEKFKPYTDEQFFALQGKQHGLKGSDRQFSDLCALSVRHSHLAERHCSSPNFRESEYEPVENRITSLAKTLGAKGVYFSHDPRGCTVRLILEDGYTNDWGREGFCVPQ